MIQKVGLTDFAYLIPVEKFVYKSRNVWNLSEPVGKDGIINHLLEGGWDLEAIGGVIKGRKYLRVYGADLIPKQGPVYTAPDGKLYLNTWTAPTLTPNPRPYPRIQRVIEWVTRGDKAGEKWLKAWMAYKVQNPSVVPKVAVLITSEPGGGKGTLAFLMREMLGPSNCATIKREELENRFNSRWIGKLFVLADEVISRDNQKDISEMLKVLVDADKVELEGKYRDQREVKNRLAWMFASNDTTAPLTVDKNDRRYSVFSNHDSLPPDYANMLRSCFQSDNTPAPEFVEEMRGYFAELLSIQVDRNYVSTPYENESRALLIEANKPAHDLFCEHVNEAGVDELLDYVVQHTAFHLGKTRHEWDFGADGIATNVLHTCYQEFCKRIGARSMKVNKFGAAMRNHRPAWPQTRPSVQGSSRRVYCYVVPRKLRAVAA